MRTLTDHIVEGDSANHQLTITVTDEPGAGGANHRYEIGGMSTESNPSRHAAEPYGDIPAEGGTVVLFQNGPIKEFGVNGVTQEAFATIIIDRLRSFQAGPFSGDLQCAGTGVLREGPRLAPAADERSNRPQCRGNAPAIAVAAQSASCKP